MGRRSASRGEPRKPLYQRAAEALAAILAQTPEGAFLPSEPALAKQLGVSRATLREAMRSFEERGLVVRRQGVGTRVRGTVPVIETGLESLESIETLAARSGLQIEMGDLSILEHQAGEEESHLFGIALGVPLREVTRVIAADGRPVAYLVDQVPCDLLPSGALQEGFSGSVLDLLQARGEPPLGVSRTEVTAVSAPAPIARRLNIQRGDVLLCFEAFLYSQVGRVVDHSFSYFLPGTFRFHILRRVGHSANGSGRARTAVA